MVLGVLISAVIGAIMGYVIGWVIEIFPGFNQALVGGIQMFTGIDLDGQLKIMLTGLGFILGLISGIIAMFARKRH